MRKYGSEMMDRLQNDVSIKIENGVEYQIKPIPDLDKIEGMDPRMLQAAKEKMKKLPGHFSVETYQIYEERVRPDKVNYDLTTELVRIKQQLIPVENHYINTFFYKPWQSEEDIPAVIYVHGGGFMTGDHKQFENQCKLIAQTAGALVIFPEYRLAPENPYPAGENDVWGILQWVYANAEMLHICRERLVMAGDSAGASIINGCALRDQDRRIKLLFEIYPCCDIDSVHNVKYPWKESYYHIPEKERSYIYSRMERLMNMGFCMKELYLMGEAADNPRVSIIYQDDFEHFPMVVTAIGEYDYLRMSSDIFSEKCKKSGRLKRAIRYQGCDHGFFDMLGIMPQAEDVIMELAKEVKNI